MATKATPTSCAEGRDDIFPRLTPVTSPRAATAAPCLQEATVLSANLSNYLQEHNVIGKEKVKIPNSQVEVHSSCEKRK